MPMIRLSEMYLIAAEGWMEDDPEHAAELLQTLKQARTKSIVNKQTVTEEMILLEMRDLFRRITGYMMKQQVAAGFLARHVTLWI